MAREIQLLETAAHHLCVREVGEHYYKVVNVSTVFWTQFFGQDYERWQKVAALVGHWNLRNYGSYAIAEKISGKVIGVAGLDYPLDWPEPEIQWGLARTYWGKGYASETVRAVKRMSREYVPNLSLISLIHPNNSNSIALAKAVGAHFEKERLFRGDTWLISAIDLPRIRKLHRPN